jgi:hypothetical protein
MSSWTSMFEPLMSQKAEPMEYQHWNRIKSVDGAYIRDQQSQDMFSYTQISEKFEHPTKCRNALGLVGGAEVSNIEGNLVDLESELLNITRNQAKCIKQQYNPACPLGGSNCPDYPVGGIKIVDKTTGEEHTINTAPRDLPTCQMFSYPGTPMPGSLTQTTCQPLRF